jgi:cytochrome P450
VADLVLDPYSYAFHDDPYPTYARLRAEAPVYRNDELGFYALSRHADVVAGFGDAARLSSKDGPSADRYAAGSHAERTASFLAMDDPRHGRLRSLVSRGFTPRRVAQLEPRIRELTRQHLAAALDGDTFDFMTDLAGLLPMDVISELLGVPASDRDELRRMADLLVHREEGVNDVPPAALDASIGLFSYYDAMVADRRARPTDDLTSAVLAAEIDGDRLSHEEVTGFLFLMVIAGNETTTKLLGNAWWWAWRNPDERVKPFTDAAAVPAWVEEALRYDTSSQILARTAVTDIELHDEVIPDGARVLLLPGSANRDTAVFPDGDDFRIGRDTSEMASFGFGRHFCLGAAMARLEARVCLDELVRSVASFDIDAEAAVRVHSVNVRGFAVLPTQVTPR